MSDHQLSYTSVVTPNGAKSRVILEKLGGKQQVPFLVDTENGEMMYESDDIVAYLEENYA